jgi:hypothetical protein
MRQIIECDQGSPEWIAARMGIPTASMFQTIITPKGPREARRARNVHAQAGGRAAARTSPWRISRTSTWSAANTWRPRPAITTPSRDIEPQRVGFITNHGAGCSPDSLIGDDGMLEIKTAEPHILIGRLVVTTFRRSTRRSARARSGSPSASGSTARSIGPAADGDPPRLPRRAVHQGLGGGDRPLQRRARRAGRARAALRNAGSRARQRADGGLKGHN